MNKPRKRRAIQQNIAIQEKKDKLEVKTRRPKLHICTQKTATDTRAATFESKEVVPGQAPYIARDPAKMLPPLLVLKIIDDPASSSALDAVELFNVAYEGVPFPY